MYMVSCIPGYIQFKALKSKPSVQYSQYGMYNSQYYYPNSIAIHATASDTNKHSRLALLLMAGLEKLILCCQ